MICDPQVASPDELLPLQQSMNVWDWFDLSDALFVIVQVFDDVTIVQ